MCHSQTNNREIDKLHKRYLWIVYNDKQSLFKDFPEKGSSVPIHERNVQILATEMYKVSYNVLPPNINKILEERNERLYSLRLQSFS